MNLTKDEKIKKIKDQIAECRDYISSDFCKSCNDMYQKIEILNKKLKDLENDTTECN